MIFEPNDKIKKKMTKDGSILKYMYSAAGIGKGLVAGGGMLVFVGVILAAMMMPNFETSAAVMAGGAGIVPGLLLAVLGAFLQKRRDDGWLKAYVKNTHLPEQDILRMDEELKEPGVLFFAATSGKDANSLKKMGFVTSHYVKFPGVNPVMTRLEDLVACFYTKKYLCKDGGYDKAFVAYSRDKNMAFLDSDFKENSAQGVVEMLAQRNPAMVTHHHFLYQGKEYDAARGMDEVIALYNTVTGASGS